MHGKGARDHCPNCRTPVIDLPDILANRELKGPRNITSANVDRIFDDRGHRFLVIEEKQPHEGISEGQRGLLRALAGVPCIDVWLTQGTPDALTVSKIESGKRKQIRAGDFDTYQDAVFRWFASPLSLVSPESPPAAADAVGWRDFLEAVSQMPPTSPPWCPSDKWDALKQAVLAVHAERARAEAS